MSIQNGVATATNPVVRHRRSMFAGLILGFTAGYLGLGLAFAIVFASFGVQRVDPAARASGVVFRAMIVPGCTLLWPVLACAWIHVARRSQS